MSDVEQIESDIDSRINPRSTSHSRTYQCINVVLRATFSTPGLVILVIFYSVFGALIFPLLEAPTEIHNKISISKSREDCLKELWTITGKLLNRVVCERKV